jgi:hypothetical protein
MHLRQKRSQVMLLFMRTVVVQRPGGFKRPKLSDTHPTLSSLCADIPPHEGEGEYLAAL